MVLECEINENTKNFALHGVGSALSIFHFLKGNANRYFDQSGTGCVFYQSRKDALVARKAILRISKFSFYVFRREEAEKLINKYQSASNIDSKGEGKTILFSYSGQ